MKKSVKITIAVILILIIFSTFRKDPLDKVQFTNDINDVVTPSVLDKSKKYTVDFTLCEKGDGFKTLDNGGSKKLEITDKTATECYAETTFESNGGFFKNICRIPLSVGIQEFNGSDFENIAQYCEISTQGSDALDLK